MIRDSIEMQNRERHIENNNKQVKFRINKEVKNIIVLKIK